MLLSILAVQDPSSVRVGRVTGVYWEGDEGLATLLAELADGAGPWPGLDEPGLRPIRLVLAPDDARFDSLTRGRLPEWGVGAAFPGSNTILLEATGDPRTLQRVLRHELAHLALHEAVRRVPLWFDEGYAAHAAGEWDVRDALAVNWVVLRGVRPSLGQLDRHLRGASAADAGAAYALAMTAVVLLERIGGTRGLSALLSTLETTADFDAALRSTHQITLGQFEERWYQELRGRYGWMLLVTSVSVFWALAAIVLVALWSQRRARDRMRRLALEQSPMPEHEHEDGILDA